MDKIPFNVSARTARLIGRENVNNADGAIIELVKNGYDADAKKVTVLFSENNDLYIVDNGHGMNDNVIRNSWMTIGTNNKEMDPLSPQKRIKSGAKGIGRFALDRLGERVEMFTLPKGKKDGYQWSVDWNDFEKKEITVSDVKASLQEIKDLNLLDKLPPSYKDVKDSEKISFPEGGTILKISSLRDTWEEPTLDNLYRNLESLVPPIEKESFLIAMHSLKDTNKFGLVQPLINDDFDYRISAKYDNKTKTISAVLERNEFDVNILEKKFSKVFEFEKMSEYPYTLETFKKGKYEKTYEINDIIRGFTDSNDNLSKIGNFSFIFTFAKNQAPNKEEATKYPYRNAEYKSRGDWLRNFGGVKIFRDNFRVRPYGEKGEDWLRLGERQAQSPAGPGQRLNGFRVRPNQVTGAINISRIHNLSFQDKSSREGIQENETFVLFRNIIIGIINLLERDRNNVFYYLSELYKQTDEKERIKVEAREAANRIKKETGESSDNKSSENSYISEDAKKVAEALDVLEEEIEERHEEIKILRSLASAGLITAAVAHELRGLENILATRNKELRTLLSPYVKEEDLKGVKDPFNPYVLLKDMEHTDKTLQEWLNYALMPLRKDKRTRKTIFLKEYLDRLSSTWFNILNERKIKLIIDGIDTSLALKLFPIDLDTVFNNLIINSIEAFTRKKEIIEREIIISCQKKGGRLHMIYSDNGVGLDPAYKKDPNIIFLPQETSKKDSTGMTIGTGMGMYLIKSVVDENGGNVELLSPTKGFSISVSLPILNKL